jgi:hypothetical protein
MELMYPLGQGSRKAVEMTVAITLHSPGRMLRNMGPKREVTVHVTPVSRKSSLSEEAVNPALGANQWLYRICAAINCAANRSCLSIYLCPFNASKQASIWLLLAMKKKGDNVIPATIDINFTCYSTRQSPTL